MDFIIKNIDNSYEHIANSLLIYLYEYVNRYYDEYKNQELEGKIEVLRGYQSMIDYLQEKFPKLYILISRNTYLEFEDELCKQYIANELGDGLGIIESDVNSLTKYSINDTLRIPSGVKKFNELKYFTSLTNLSGTKTGGNFDVWRLTCDTLEEINLRNVTYIGQGTFNGMSNLKIVNESNNVTEIGQWAFRNCSSLNNINFPSVRKLNYATFYNCSSLTSVDFDNVTLPDKTRDSYVFQGCTSLKTAHIDGPNTTLGSGTFYLCGSLETFSGFSNLTELGNATFSGCTSLINCDIPYENLTSLGSNAFNGCALLDFANEDLTNVTSFGQNCFRSTGIRSITFGVSPITFGTEVFYKSKIETIVLPNNMTTSVSDLGQCFRECPNLTSVTLPNQLSYNIPGLFCYQCPQLTTVNISNDTTSIPIINDSAFRNCSSLTTIDLSKTVQIKSNAFNGCSSLESIDLSSLEDIKNNAFTNCIGINHISNINNLITSESNAFTNVGNNENTIGKIEMHSIVIIPQQMFYNAKGFTEIEFRDVTAINQQAFRYCSNLTKVTGLDNVISLDWGSFESSGIVNIDIPSLVEFRHIMFQNCKSLKSASLNGVTTISGGSHFYGCSSLETLSLQSIESLGVNNFLYGCTSLKNVDIRSCKSIGNEMFRDKTALENVNLSSLETGVRYMFMGCTSLKTVSLPKMESIPQDGFRNDSELTTVTITSVTTTIGQSCFNTCRKLENIDLSHVINIKGWAFENCIKLQSINLSSCEELLEGAFKGCTGLNTDIVLPAAITSIPKELFYNDASINSISIMYSGGIITSLGANAFNPGTYPIYVPDALLSSYIASSTWSGYKTRLFGLSSKP